MPYNTVSHVTTGVANFSDFICKLSLESIIEVQSRNRWLLNMDARLELENIPS